MGRSGPAASRTAVLFFSPAGGSDEGDAGVQSIEPAVVVVTPSDYFELTARETSTSTNNVAADVIAGCGVPDLGGDGGGDPPAVARRPVAVVALGQSRSLASPGATAVWS